MEDEKIVELYWLRSEQAISETAEKYGGYCGRIARNILINELDTEECLNDTWMAAWNAMPPHRPSILKTFLAKLTRRLAITRWRDAHRDKRGGGEAALALEELSECLDSGESVEDKVIAVELNEAVNRFIKSLPDDERRVFLRRYWYLDSMEEISRRFDFSIGKVKSMLHRTRLKLNEYLQKEGFR